MSNPIEVVVKKYMTKEPIVVVLSNYPKFFPIYAKSKLIMVERAIGRLELRLRAMDEILLHEKVVAHIDLRCRTNEEIELTEKVTGRIDLRCKGNSELVMDTSCRGRINIHTQAKQEQIEFTTRGRATVAIFTKNKDVNYKTMREVNQMKIKDFCMTEIK